MNKVSWTASSSLILLLVAGCATHSQPPIHVPPPKVPVPPAALMIPPSSDSYSQNFQNWLNRALERLTGMPRSSEPSKNTREP
jgi:hypothetical protein